MKRVRTFLPAAAILIAAGFCHLYGIGWGVPDRERILLVFGDEETVRDLTPEMLRTHEEIRDMQEFYGAEYDPSYRLEEETSVRVGRRTVFLNREMLNAFRSYLTRSYGADEQAVVASLSRMNPKRMQFNPRFFEYGGVYLYPAGAFLAVCSAAGMVDLRSDMSFYFLHPELLGRIYILLRLFGALGALLALGPFFLACRTLTGNRELSLWMTAFFGICPAIAIWSHYLKPYSYGLLWIACTLWAVAVFRENGRGRWILAAAAFAGLAFGSILSYGYALWFVLLAVALAPRSLSWKTRYGLVSLAVFLGVFLVTNPYVLLAGREFLSEMGYIRRYWAGSPVASSFSLYLFNSLRVGTGTVLWAMLLGGTVLAFAFRPDSRSLILLAALLPGFIYFGVKTSQWVHYGIPVYPVLFLLAAVGMSRIRPRLLRRILLAVCLGWTLLYTGSHVRLFGGENVRTQAGRWINRMVPEGAGIGMLEYPAPWRTPPFLYLRNPVAVRGKVGKKGPLFFVVSEYQWIRGGNRIMEDAVEGYQLLQEFRRPPSLGPWVLRSPGAMPHDWFHANPVIQIWERRTE